MANPLQLGSGSPEAPLDDGDAHSQPQLMGSPMPAPGGPAAPLQAAAAQPPAPSHDQTVAALRHFHAVEAELQSLAKNPELGKSDIKSAIIDGTTKLVAARILTPAEAVMQLGEVPERPFDQKNWVQQHLMKAMQAQNMVLDHHRAANVRMGDWRTDTAPATPSADGHTDAMKGVMEHYQGRQPKPAPSSGDDLAQRDQINAAFH